MLRIVLLIIYSWGAFMTNTEGYVYFSIKTEDQSIEIETITKILGFEPTKFKKMYSEGYKPRCTYWDYGFERCTNPDICHMIESIIMKLQPLKDNLIHLKAHKDVYYTLQVVLYHGDNAEGVHLEPNQIRFLAEIEASIDIDQYNWKD